MNSSMIYDILMLMATVLFVMGIFSSITGIIILTTRTTGRDIRTLATQTTRLAQKGLAEDVAGLVGNASSLLDAINKLVRTTAGVGVFLTIVGLIFIIAASWIALKIY